MIGTAMVDVEVVGDWDWGDCAARDVSNPAIVTETRLSHHHNKHYSLVYGISGGERMTEMIGRTMKRSGLPRRHEQEGNVVLFVCSVHPLLGAAAAHRLATNTTPSCCPFPGLPEPSMQHPFASVSRIMKFHPPACPPGIRALRRAFVSNAHVDFIQRPVFEISGQVSHVVTRRDLRVGTQRKRLNIACCLATMTQQVWSDQSSSATASPHTT